MEDAAGGHAANILIVVDVGDQHLKRCIGVAFGGANIGFNHSKERFQIGGFNIDVQLGITELGAGVNHRKVQLIIRSVQFTEQVKDHVENFIRTRTGTVDLVDDNNRLEAEVKGLFQHETGLGHGAVQSIHQQQH